MGEEGGDRPCLTIIWYSWLTSEGLMNSPLFFLSAVRRFRMLEGTRGRGAARQGHQNGGKGRKGKSGKDALDDGLQDRQL